MTLESQPTSAEQTQEIELIRTLLAKVGTLVEVLPGYKTPEREVRIMEFIPQPHPIYTYPATLRDWLQERPLTSIQLSTASDEEGFLSTTLAFQAGKEPSVLHVSRSSAPLELSSPDATHDTVVHKGGRLTPFAKMDNREIDTFLLSIVGNHLDASVQAQSSATNPVITDQLSHALHRNAISATISRQFTLSLNRIVEFNIDFTGDKPRLTSFVFYYETGSRRRLRASIDCSKGFIVLFDTIDEHVEPLHPDDGDYIRLIEIIDQEIAAIQKGNLGEIATNPLSLGELE